MTSSNVLVWNTKHILLNSLGSKQILVMTFGQFMWKYKTKYYFIKKLCENFGLKTSSRPFVIFKESSVKRFLRRPACWFRSILVALHYRSILSGLFQKYFFSDKYCASFFANTKKPGSSFQAPVFAEFFDEIISFNRLCLLPSYSIKCISCFMLRHLMMSWNVNI